MIQLTVHGVTYAIPCRMIEAITMEPYVFLGVRMRTWVLLVRLSKHSVYSFRLPQDEVESLYHLCLQQYDEWLHLNATTTL